MGTLDLSITECLDGSRINLDLPSKKNLKIIDEFITKKLSSQPDELINFNKKI
jgi:hypothetical protein